jgi:hypothetical protein
MTVHGQKLKITSAVVKNMVHFEIEDADTSQKYQKKLATSKVRRILTKLFDNNIEKLLQNVMIDKEGNSLYIPGESIFTIETLHTEASDTGLNQSNDMESLGRTAPFKKPRASADILLPKTSNKRYSTFK